MVGLKYDILLLMKQSMSIQEETYSFVQKILWVYEDNKSIFDKETDRYEFWKIKKDYIQKDIDNERTDRDSFNKFSESYDIEMLTNYLGQYKLIVSFAKSEKEFSKNFLDELQEKLSKTDSNAPQKANESKTEEKS